MNTLKTIQPNRLEQAREALKKLKYDVPTEIREDEAHLTHLIVATAKPNVKTMEFDVRAKVVKLDEQTVTATKNEMPKFGLNVVLHDGRKYQQTQKANAGTQTVEAKKEEAGKNDEALTLKDNTIKNLQEEQANKDAKAQADKARLVRMLGLGYVFDGVNFSKGEDVYSEEEVYNLEAERFEEFVTDEHAKTVEAKKEEAKDNGADANAKEPKEVAGAKEATEKTAKPSGKGK